MKFIGIFLAVALVAGIIMIGATNAGDKHCVKWETVYPTPTPIPLSNIYSEWIPTPGTSPGTGHGWIRATDLAKAQAQWPPRQLLTAHVLTDAEYAAIEENHGLRMTRGGKWGYGFPPRIGFNTIYGGVILKNEWLPLRLQKSANQ